MEGIWYAEQVWPVVPLAAHAAGETSHLHEGIVSFPIHTSNDFLSLNKKLENAVQASTVEPSTEVILAHGD